MKDQSILNIIANDIAGKTFDEYDGFLGLYAKMRELKIESNLSDALNYVLYKKRRIEAGDMWVPARLVEASK
jgi:hypothetical protein